MTTRQFLISWAKLILLAASLIVMHIIVQTYGADSIAALIAPKFTPLTALEEEQHQLKLKQAQIEKNIEAKERCQYLENSENSYSSRYTYGTCFKLVSSNWAIYHPKKIHELEVIDPIAKKIRHDFLPWFFGLLYIIVGIFMLGSLWKWMAETVIPVSQSNIKAIKNRVGDETMLWTNRKMSTAVKQLDDLENLFERGMITREVLEERKAEIKKALAK